MVPRLRRVAQTLFWLLAVVPLPAAARTPAPPPTPARLSFNEHIRPILSENCFACHGPDSSNREAGLRLDQEVAATAELDSGLRAIVPQFNL